MKSSKSTQTLVNLPKSIQDQTLEKPMSGRFTQNYIYKKHDIGEDVQAKIKSLQEICYSKGMTQEQVLWTTALVDHESGGSWNEKEKGDGGCSIGIGQWNKCVGRIAPPTFNNQADLICSEMKQKYDRFGIKTGVGKHNAPAWNSNPKYLKRVERSTHEFK